MWDGAVVRPELPARCVQLPLTADYMERASETAGRDGVLAKHTSGTSLEKTLAFINV